MAIATLPTTGATITVVYCDDPDVTPDDDEARGWVSADTCKVEDGADVLEVRPLNVDERAKTADVEGRSVMMLARARAGLVAANGKRGEKARAAWLNGCPDDAVFLLGLYVGALTNNVEPQILQRAILGLAEDDDDDASPEGE